MIRAPRQPASVSFRLNFETDGGKGPRRVEIWRRVEPDSKSCVTDQPPGESNGISSGGKQHLLFNRCASTEGQQAARPQHAAKRARPIRLGPAIGDDLIPVFCCLDGNGQCIENELVNFWRGVLTALKEGAARALNEVKWQFQF